MLCEGTDEIQLKLRMRPVSSKQHSADLRRQPFGLSYPCFPKEDPKLSYPRQKYGKEHVPSWHNIPNFKKTPRRSSRGDSGGHPLLAIKWCRLSAINNNITVQNLNVPPSILHHARDLWRDVMWWDTRCTVRSGSRLMWPVLMKSHDSYETVRLTISNKKLPGSVQIVDYNTLHQRFEKLQKDEATRASYGFLQYPSSPRNSFI